MLLHDPATQRHYYLRPRPVDELDQISKDPDQFTNLADHPDYATQLKEMKTLLDCWEEETGDSVPRHPTPDRQIIEGKNAPLLRGDRPGDSRHATTINVPGPVWVD